MSNIKTYIGVDGKIHFVDSEGADTVLPFNSGSTIENIAYNKSGTQTFDISSLFPDNYNTFTIDNFFIVATGMKIVSNNINNIGSTTASASTSNVGNNTVVKSYDNSSGILTVTIPNATGSTATDGHYRYTNTSTGRGSMVYYRGTVSSNIVYSVYLVY